MAFYKVTAWVALQDSDVLNPVEYSTELEFWVISKTKRSLTKAIEDKAKSMGGTLSKTVSVKQIVSDCAGKRTEKLIKAVSSPRYDDVFFGGLSRLI